MKNKEYYIDELIDELMNGEACNFIQRYDLGCMADCVTCEEHFMNWLEREHEPIESKIDWSKVPLNTPILVRDNENDEWIHRTFACYNPESALPFICIGNISCCAVYWRYGKLPEYMDVTPYLKEI